MSTEGLTWGMSIPGGQIKRLNQKKTKLFISAQHWVYLFITTKTISKTAATSTTTTLNQYNNCKWESVKAQKEG